MIYFLFFLGFIFLIKGADLLVDGAGAIARRFEVSNIVIGLTIVAFGTSAPELVVSVVSAIEGETDIAIANVLGSNIANTALILGVSALIFPLLIRRNTARSEIPYCLMATVIVGILANDALIDGASSSFLTRTDGLVLLAFFGLFLRYAFGIARQRDATDDEVEVKDFGPLKAGLYVILGLVGLTLGGEWIVRGAVEIAQSWGISKRVIGLTVIAFGTSLPELAACAVAAWKKHADLVVGGIIGSNIFNLLWILGVGATIRPLPFVRESQIDIGVNLVAMLLLLAFMFVGRLYARVERWQGFVLVTIYVVYIASTL